MYLGASRRFSFARKAKSGREPDSLDNPCVVARESPGRSEVGHELPLGLVELLLRDQTLLEKFAQSFDELSAWKAGAAEVFGEAGPRFISLVVGPTPIAYLRAASLPITEQVASLRGALGTV